MNTAYFIGRYCTIITRPINRSFKEEILLQYFTGVVHSINNEVLFLTQLDGSLMTAIYKDQIVAIAEERIENNEQKIQEFKTEAKPMPPVTYPAAKENPQKEYRTEASMDVQKELNLQAMKEANKLLKSVYNKKT
jgi:hypothetical protein